MNDPHVVSLTYRVRHSKTVDFDRAPPLIAVDPRGAFRISLDAYEAKVEMVDHFASEGRGAQGDRAIFARMGITGGP